MLGPRNSISTARGTAELSYHFPGEAITTTWFGMAGPGVTGQGRNDSVFSDHADLRPTVTAPLGLTDDYVSDGRVLMEFVAPELVPDRHQ
jgi:hypothetical protein